MKVTINNTDYIIKWHHQNNVEENLLIAKGLATTNKINPSFTHCWIECDGITIAEATAHLHKKDKMFNKEYGRKWSLKRCLEKLDIFKKSDRKELYRQYFKLINSKYTVE